MSVPSKRSLLAMDLEQMTVAELKEILRSLNLPLVCLLYTSPSPRD